MSRSSLSSTTNWGARLFRFRRVMLIRIEAGEQGLTTAVTSNLSRGGLAAIGDNQLEPGDQLSVRFGDQLQVAATVVWHVGRRFGVKFDRELNLFEYFGAQLQVRKWH